MSPVDLKSMLEQRFSEAIPLPFETEIMSPQSLVRESQILTGQAQSDQPDSVTSSGRLEAHALDPAIVRLHDRQMIYELPINADPDPDPIEDEIPTSLVLPLTAFMWPGVITAVSSSLFLYKAESIHDFSEIFWDPALGRKMEVDQFQEPAVRLFDPTRVKTNLSRVGDECVLFFTGPNYNDVVLYSVGHEEIDTQKACV